MDPEYVCHCVSVCPDVPINILSGQLGSGRLGRWLQMSQSLGLFVFGTALPCQGEVEEGREGVSEAQPDLPCTFLL